MFGRSNQSAATNGTDTLSVDDETLSTADSDIPRPAGAGEFKTTIRWITPIYGQRVIQEKDPNQRSGK